MAKDDLRRRARYLLQSTAVNHAIAKCLKKLRRPSVRGFSRQIEPSAGEEAVSAPIDTASDALVELVDDEEQPGLDAAVAVETPRG